MGRLVSRLGLELALWLCLPAAFLFVYVDRHLAPGDAVLPHLRLVLGAVLALALVRLALAASLGAALARLAGAALATGLLASMLAYYALALVGLGSWGRVVTWDLIESYSTQVRPLADALGISLPLAAVALCLALLALFAAAWLYLRHFDWTPFVARQASRAVFAAVLLCGSAVWAIELYSFAAAPPTRQAEPLSLTFHPMEAARDFQGHAVDRLRAARLDAAEDAARASYQPAAAAQRRNLVLIVVDALRPDHMGVYGYARDTTPYLSELERAGVLRKVSGVRSACSSSACGVLSILSSKFVHQFSERPFTLQEALRRHGYRIHLLLSGDHTSFYDLKQVYGAVDSYFDGHGLRKFKHLNDDRLVLEQLAAFPAWDGGPVMLQFHLMSAHILGKRDGAAAKYAPSATYAALSTRNADNTPSERGINFYDNGVVQTDAVIRTLLATLERKGYLKSALVAITADHGEALGEHGLYQHANSVREEVLRVPFLLLSYGYRPARPIDGQSVPAQVDIAPTLLAELGMPRPQTWTGTPLQERLARQFTHFQELAEAGLFDHRDPRDPWKYWINHRSGEEYAFRLSVDPQERSNAVERAPRELLREWRLKVLAGATVHASRK